MSNVEPEIQDLANKFMEDYPSLTKAETLERYNDLLASFITSEYGTCLEYFIDNFQTWNSKTREIDKEAFAVFLDKEIEVLDYEGGYEGGGEACHEVIKFIAKDLTVMQEGNYYSYDGTHWAGEYEEVVAKEVTVTTWVRV